MNRAWIIGAVIVAAGAGWYGVAAGTGAAASNEAQTEPAQVAGASPAVQLEVAALRAQVNALRDEVAAARTAPGSPAGGHERASSRAGDDGASAPAPPDPELARRRGQEMIQAASRRLDHALAAEPVDTAWRADYEAAVDDYLAAQAPGGYDVDELDCRTNMCRMRVSYRDGGGREQLLAALGGGPFTEGSFFRPDDSGDGTIVYLARPGRGAEFRAALADASTGP